MGTLEREKMKLHEGIVEEIMKLIIFTPLKRKLKKAMKELDEDPEFVAAGHSLNYHLDRMEDLLKNLCSRIPDHPECKRKRWNPRNDK